MTYEEVSQYVNGEIESSIDLYKSLLDGTAKEIKEAIMDGIEQWGLIAVAVEKQIPKKPISGQTDDHCDCWKCPSCTTFLEFKLPNNNIVYGDDYCYSCGQKMDWGGDNA